MSKRKACAGDTKDQHESSSDYEDAPWKVMIRSCDMDNVTLRGRVYNAEGRCGKTLLARVEQQDGKLAVRIDCVEAPEFWLCVELPAKKLKAHKQNTDSDKENKAERSDTEPESHEFNLYESV